jgi:hypothetical protein
MPRRERPLYVGARPREGTQRRRDALLAAWRARVDLARENALENERGLAEAVRRDGHAGGLAFLERFTFEDAEAMIRCVGNGMIFIRPNSPAKFIRWLELLCLSERLETFEDGLRYGEVGRDPNEQPRDRQGRYRSRRV